MIAAHASPDLLIRVHFKSKELFFELKAPDPELDLNFKSYGPHPFLMDPETYFQHFMKKVEDQAQQIRWSKGNKEEERLLEKVGLNLFEEVFPKDLQDMLWRLRPFVQTLHILSDEPWIPWEICKFQTSSEGRVEEGLFFCEQFKMTRWCGPTTPAQFFHMKQMAVVGIGGQKLAHVEEEVELLKGYEHNQREVLEIEPSLVAVEKAMKEGVYDGWHFAGHGDKPEGGSESSLTLARGNLLTPQTISGLSQKMGLPHPLIFFNACYSGRSNLSLTRLGGWAHRFMKIGAGAFLGTQWAVEDKSAYEFAKSFYDRFLKGVPLAEAVHKARCEIRKNGDASWLAYVAYGDPYAQIAEDPSQLFKKFILKRLKDQHRTVQTYLDRNGVNVEQLADALVEKSQGNRTYIKHMVREITEGTYQSTPPQRLPQGSNHYFRDLLSLLKESTSKEEWEEHRTILAILCVAKEPLPFPTLAKFSGMGDRRLVAILQTWKPFLVGDSQKPYLEESLQKFLEKEGFLDLTQAHRQIVRAVRDAFFPS